mgnify:CR=1 FL=1
MKKSELKKILKPLVKECIQESLTEEGLLKNIVSQVVEGYSMGSGSQIVEQAAPQQDNSQADQESQKVKKKLDETKKKMMDAIGRGSYGGVDIFQGTTPAPADKSSQNSVMEGVDPRDPGVDISKIFNQNWGKLI